MIAEKINKVLIIGPTQRQFRRLEQRSQLKLKCAADYPHSFSADFILVWGRFVSHEVVSHVKKSKIPYKILSPNVGFSGLVDALEKLN